MTALRQFSLVYVVAAVAYAVAMALSSHPVWQKNAEVASAYVEHQSFEAAVAVNRHVLRPGWHLAGDVADDVGRRVVDAIFPGHHVGPAEPTRMAKAAPPQKIARATPVSHPSLAKRHEPERAVALNAPPSPIIAVPLSAPPSPPRTAALNTPPPVTHAVAPRPSLTLVPSAPAPQSAPPTVMGSLPPNAPAASAGDIIRVTQRLRDNLTSEMLANFELFLYVSKADAGPWAQRMYVFQKQPTGDLKLLYNWPVSTGREKVEFNPGGRKVMTDTPPGYYELDPHRSYAHYDSQEWGKPMPYAMFFNWVKDGNQTGLAIHAADGDDEKLIGKRASAGCVHLTQEDARTLFTLIRTNYRGLAPRFAIDRRTGTMSNEGILMHDANGHVKLAEGYKVLIFIENFGGENVVAALF